MYLHILIIPLTVYQIYYVIIKLSFKKRKTMNYSDMVEINQSFPTWVFILVFALVVLVNNVKSYGLVASSSKSI